VSDKSAIEWTDASWPVITGCTHISTGCDHCYAAKLTSTRLRHLPEYAGLAENGRFNGTVRLLTDRLDWPLKWRKPRRIFVSDMADLFHRDVPDGFIACVFAVMARTPQHTYQVLTKRHARMKSLLNSEEFWNQMWLAAMVRGWDLEGTPCPLPNVHLGVSAEDQRWADIRIPALLDTPAAVRFISAEPLLGPIDLHGPIVNGHRPRLTYWLDGRPGWGPEQREPNGLITQELTVGPSLAWVIAGGESGPGARPVHPDWIRSLRDQCQASGVPFFFKQWGEWGPAPWRVEREPGETDSDYKTRAEGECATHAYAVWADRYGHEPHKPTHKPWSLERGTLPPQQAPIRRWGKGRAGRLLDGREWSEFPRAVEAVAL
jgi:protein gp37